MKPRHRARMVGFMCEALHKLDCSSQTFFRAVDLLDMYFEAAPDGVPQCELHLLGIACMLIASKYEDRYPLPIDVLRCKVAHSAYSVVDILKMELDVLATLQFRVGARPTLFELAERLVQQRFPLSADNLQPFVETLARTACFDHSLLERNSREALAEAIVKHSSDSYRQINGHESDETPVEDENIAGLAAALEKLYMNFPRRFPLLPEVYRLLGLF